MGRSDSGGFAKFQGENNGKELPKGGNYVQPDKTGKLQRLTEMHDRMSTVFENFTALQHPYVD